MTRNETILLGKEYQKMLSKIEKKGYRLFLLALQKSASKVLPYFNIYGGYSTNINIDSLVDSEIIKDAYFRFYKAAISIALVDSTKIQIKAVQGRFSKVEAIDNINIGFRNAELIKHVSDIADKMALAENVVGVSDYTKKLIKDTITKGLADNKSEVQIARDISNVTKGRISKMRALRISRTETTSASSEATKILSDNIPFEQNKIWIPRLDGRERPEHGAMLGMKPIPKKELFIIGGEDLEYPGDSSHGASASNLVNCRCSVHYIPIEPKEEEVIFDTPQPKKTILSSLKLFLSQLLLADLFSF